MRTTEDIIRYASAAGHAISKQKDADAIMVKMRAGLRATVDVPNNCLEWFITITDEQSGRELFADWTDHYTTTQDPMSEAELTDERAECVITMLRVLADYECRVGWDGGFAFLGRRWFRSKVLQANTESGWKDVWEIGAKEDCE